MKITDVKHLDELHQILAVQNENHFSNLSESSKDQKGFLTVKHSFETLSLMQSKAPQVIAKDGDVLAGFALVMLKEFKMLIPELVSMFKTFETVSYNSKILCETKYYVMGQICVREGYKRRGIFTQLYHKHRALFSHLYDYCITEVSTNNKPSLLAHNKVGFKTIHTFKDQLEEWHVMLWDWS